MKKEVVITANDLPAEVVAAIKSGRKIEAIRLLRVATGLGLANAKVLVDAGTRLHDVPNNHPMMMHARRNQFIWVKPLAIGLSIAAAYWYFAG
jgi:hypothetical protein